MVLITLKGVLNALKSILNTSDIMKSILNTSDRRPKKLKGQEHNGLETPRVVHNSPSLTESHSALQHFREIMSTLFQQETYMVGPSFILL